ncbi:SRPBCC family protein [Ferrimonas balearica]|uniref:SRPBCC family protein n=1 Tax=Ferrimonas balearica TaxID=44012 RepID=UPI001C993C7D|nr:SRPBCC family protein [Ferrimonas balearica]MBY5923007.1 SRPBCC family protein [Ferrimonas balearica]MBY5997616.1 SRPBCC family protein [Ferrimonas balearica]
MRNALKVLLTVLLVVAIAGLILPDEFEVSRSVRINAPADQVHPYLDDLTLWPLWNPFQTGEVTVSISRPSSGVGAHQSWQDPSGGGELWMTLSDPVHGIGYDLRFGSHPERYQAGFHYQPHGAGTIVVWEMSGQMHIPVMGAYLAMMADVMIGEQFQLGLERLKRVVEQQPSKESERP